jgi:hypothetical protein
MEAQAKVEDREHDANRVGGADLALVLAFLYPEAAFVRECGGPGTSMMRREPDGAWYFVD